MEIFCALIENKNTSVTIHLQNYNEIHPFSNYPTQSVLFRYIHTFVPHSYFLPGATIHSHFT